MHVLGELIGAGTISVAINHTVRLVHVVLAYRVECKKIELRHAELGLDPGNQPAQAAPARHAARRRRRR